MYVLFDIFIKTYIVNKEKIFLRRGFSDII